MIIRALAYFLKVTSFIGLCVIFNFYMFFETEGMTFMNLKYIVALIGSGGSGILYRLFWFLTKTKHEIANNVIIVTSFILSIAFMIVSLGV